MSTPPRSGIGKDFLLLTQYAFLAPSDQQRGKPAPDLADALSPDVKRISLPRPAAQPADAKDFLALVNRRASVREYSAEPLTQADLSYLLWCTQGVKQTLGKSATLRTVPSAGARHALETALVVNRVAGLAPGLYRYLALEHALAVQREDGGIGREACRACLDQEFVAACAVFFIWLAIPYRMTWRYGERGYRYLFLDAGHACQNLYLAAESIGCGCCAVGAYDDEALYSVVGVDGHNAFVIYAAAVGKKEGA